MFEKDPLFREVSSSNLAAYREAQQRGDRSADTREAQIERELAALDAAILGMDAARMRALREWVDLVDPNEEEASGVVRRPD